MGIEKRDVCVCVCVCVLIFGRIGVIIYVMMICDDAIIKYDSVL